MLSMGAEFGHSQNGNNNAYAQDNEISWLDWEKADPRLLAFAARALALRRRHAGLHRREFPDRRGAGRRAAGCPMARRGRRAADAGRLGRSSFPRRNLFSVGASRAALLLNAGNDVCRLSAAARAPGKTGDARSTPRPRTARPTRPWTLASRAARWRFSLRTTRNLGFKRDLPDKCQRGSRAIFKNLRASLPPSLMVAVRA